MLETININKNIRLNYIPLKKLKTTVLSVYIHRSLNENDASMNALLPYVLKRSSKLCPDMESFSKYLEKLYGASLGCSVFKRGDDQIIYFDAETISDRYTPGNEPLLAKLTELILSILFEPSSDCFDAEIVAQEKNNAVNRINALVNDKRSYASIRCQEEMCSGETFAISKLGTIKGIQSVTPETLYDYYKSIITSSVIDFYVCGDADINSAADKIHEYTDKLAFTDASVTKTEILVKSNDVKRVTDRMDVTQGKLAIGFRTNITPDSKDYPALTVFNSVFGAGAHSKLFNNVREKLSLAYYASSQLERYKGLLIVNAGIEFKNFQQAYDESLAQLEEIRNGNISDLEFESSIKSIVNSYKSTYDDQRSLAIFSLGESIIGTNETIEDKIEKINKVTINQVAEIAKKLELDTVYFLDRKEEA
ncbi:MAG: pitrilysin family protein [bacterium]|nr:pitrilysin family protein [bacterium]